MNLLKQFAGQALTYGLATILSRIVYYLMVVVLLSHILGDRVAEFGTYSYFYAYAAVLIALFSFRLDTALFRFGNKNEDINKAFSSSFIPVIFSAISIIVIASIWAEPIAKLIRFPDSARYVKWFAYILAFDIVNLIPFAKLRLQNKANTFVIYKVFNVLLSIALILFFLVILPKHENGVLSFFPKQAATIDWVFIANLIASAVLFLLLLPSIKEIKFTVDWSLTKRMLFYAFPLVIVGVANGLIQFFNAPLQEMFLDGTHHDNLEQAGIYDLTRRIAGLFVMFTTAFNYAAEPFFFNNSSSKDRKELYGKICRFFTLIGGAVVVGMYLGIDLLKYMAPSNYWESLYLLPVLLLAYLLLGIYYNVSIWYKLSDQTKYGAYISILGAVVTLTISIIFLPLIGYAASAYATLASYFLMVVVGYYLGQRKYPIDYPVKKIVINLCVISSILVTGYYIRIFAPIFLKYLLFGLLLVCYLIYVWKSEKDEWNLIFGRTT